MGSGCFSIWRSQLLVYLSICQLAKSLKISKAQSNQSLILMLTYEDYKPNLCSVRFLEIYYLYFTTTTTFKKLFYFLCVFWFTTNPAIPPQARIKIGLIIAFNKQSNIYKTKTTTKAATGAIL